MTEQQATAVVSSAVRRRNQTLEAVNMFACVAGCIAVMGMFFVPVVDTIARADALTPFCFGVAAVIAAIAFAFVGVVKLSYARAANWAYRPDMPSFNYVYVQFVLAAVSVAGALMLFAAAYMTLHPVVGLHC